LVKLPLQRLGRLPIQRGQPRAHLPRTGRLFPQLTVDRVVKAYAKLRVQRPPLHGTVFHSTRKWFITQC
jgi:hypothetical protein